MTTEITDIVDAMHEARSEGYDPDRVYLTEETIDRFIDEEKFIEPDESNPQAAASCLSLDIKRAHASEFLVSSNNRSLKYYPVGEKPFQPDSGDE